MKYSSRTIGSLLAIALIAFVAATTAAQNRERFGISAKAGGVNAVLGRVMVARTGQEPQLLSNKDDLVSGDTVTTGSLSHVEVLLNPGSYLRVGEHSEFQLKDSSLDSLQIRMLKGSAIVEATGVNDMDLQIQVVTSEATFTIIRSGVYRINVEPAFAELAVSKGRASFGPGRADVLKGGNKVIFTNGAIARAKVDKNKDEFEVWSKSRAEFLARANDRLSSKVFSAYLASLNSWDSPFSSRSRWGVWTFSPRAGCFTFLPYFYGWASPYGHYYGSYYWPGFYGQNWNGQPVIGNNRPYPGTGNPGGSPTGGTPPGPGPSPGPAPGPGPGPAPIPPTPAPRFRDPDTGERIIQKKLDP